MKQIADKVSLLIILAAFIFMLIYAYCSFYPFKVLEFGNSDEMGNGLYSVVTQEVEQGGILKYRSIFTKYMEISGTVSCFFQDGILFRTPGFTSNNPLGLNDSIRAVTVPETLPPGRYVYGCQIFYELTMHRILTYTFYTEEFDVVGKCAEI